MGTVGNDGSMISGGNAEHAASITEDVLADGTGAFRNGASSGEVSGGLAQLGQIKQPDRRRGHHARMELIMATLSPARLVGQKPLSMTKKNKSSDPTHYLPADPVTGKLLPH